MIEMLTVLTIIGVLASIAVPLSELAYQRKKEDELRVALRTIRSALDTYKKLTDEGRIARDSGGSGYPPDLRRLYVGIVDQRSPSRDAIYILRRLPRDPFSGDSSLAPEITWGLRSYQSPPDKPQPGRDVFDVYSKSTGTGLNGIPYARW